MLDDRRGQSFGHLSATWARGRLGRRNGKNQKKIGKTLLRAFFPACSRFKPLYIPTLIFTIYKLFIRTYSGIRLEAT